MHPYVLQEKSDILGKFSFQLLFLNCLFQKAKQLMKTDIRRGVRFERSVRRRCLEESIRIHTHFCSTERRKEESIARRITITTTSSTRPWTGFRKRNTATHRSKKRQVCYQTGKHRMSFEASTKNCEIICFRNSSSRLSINVKKAVERRIVFIVQFLRK